MSIFEKAKEALRLRKLKEESQEDDNEQEDEEFERELLFYDKEWTIAPHMEEILNGNYSLIPIECMLTHYLLKHHTMHTYYIALDNHESGDEFEVYEFNWVDNPSNKDNGEEEHYEPEFSLFGNVNSVDAAKFLVERVEEGYVIYIEKRKELA